MNLVQGILLFRPMLWTALAVFTVASLEDDYEWGQSKYILVELTKFETSGRW